MTHPARPGSGDAPGVVPQLPDGGQPADASRASGSPPRGGKQEFACFYRQHISRLVVYLVYQGAPAAVAAELAQKAMLTALRRWDSITTPRAYVYTVAYRAFLRYALGEAELPVAEVPEPAVLLSHPGQAEAWSQQQEIIGLLRALPPRQRQVLALTIDGWTPAEIADLLGLDPAAVRSSLLKARRGAIELRRRAEEDM
jgi:RNA polymerase sigma factor (sigma-70 family)